MTTGQKFIYVCYWVNILTLLLYIFIIIAAFLRMHEFLNYVFTDTTFLNFRLILGVPIIILWVYDMVKWSKHDKHIGRFLLIFFLLGIYSPFYFRRILKNNWLN
jgi:hypothetical protein